MSVYILLLIMKQSTRLIIFFSIVIVVWGALGIFVQNWLDNFSIQERLENNFSEEYDDREYNKYTMNEWNIDDWNNISDDNNISDFEEISENNLKKWTLTYDTNANITYIDTEWKEFRWIWTITYSDQEWNSITMLDRNLWATKSWRWEESYWYYFWWGNNYWFVNGWDISNKWKTNWYSRNNPYVSRDTNLEGTYNNGHRNLWWWADDNQENLWNPNIDNWYMRQWPCPAWYHIPSVWERTKLINIWFKHEHWMNIEYVDWMFYQYYWDLVDNFTNDFRLPYAWSRVDDIWKKWQYRWSSLSEEPYNFAYELRLYPKKEIDKRTWETPHTIVLWWSALWWWAKLSVRCFKDEYENPSSVITLKYETNWWTKIQSQTLPKWAAWFLPWYTTHKTWFELEWWYLDAWFTKKYDFSTKLDNDTIIYAKWKKSENKKNNKWTGFRLTDDEIRDYYYYNCTCPKWYSYTPEVVTYGDPWCEIKICENGNNCMTYSTSVNATCNKKLNINEIGSRVPMGSKDVENDYKRNCVCPTWFEFVKKTADMYADSCDRKYCVDSECKEIKTWHIWVKNLCKN